MAIADWLEQKLTQRRIRPSALAARLNVHPSTVSRWLSGQTQPDAFRLIDLARELDEDVNLLYALAGHSVNLPLPDVTPEESTLLLLFRSLPPDKQSIVLATVRAAAET